MIPKIGHWTQQEAPDETTRLLIDWLATLWTRRCDGCSYLWVIALSVCGAENPY